MDNWLAIPGWTNFYEVSDAGHIRSVTRTVAYGRHGATTYTGRILRPTWTTGYARVNLIRKGQREQHYVHDLVLLTFVGPKPIDREVCHGLYGSADNSLFNLRYDTRIANRRDFEQFGLDPSPARALQRKKRGHHK